MVGEDVPVLNRRALGGRILGGNKQVCNTYGRRLGGSKGASCKNTGYHGRRLSFLEDGRGHDAAVAVDPHGDLSMERLEETQRERMQQLQRLQLLLLLCHLDYGLSSIANQVVEAKLNPDGNLSSMLFSCFTKGSGS